MFRTLPTPLHLILALICFLGLAADSRGQQLQRPPNIVLFLVDDLGWKDLSCYGSDLHETPYIDQLAGEGMRFTAAYANGPNCAPTRAAILSGQYAPRTGIYTVGTAARGLARDRKLVPIENNTVLLDEVWTLPEALESAGYTSAAIGKWHLGEDPLRQGFDVNVGGDMRGSPHGGYLVPYSNPSLPDGPEGEYLTDRLTDEALAFIEQNQDGPFFLYLSHYAVHAPVQGRPDIVEGFRTRRLEEGWEGRPDYAAMIQSVDESLGRVADKLDELELAENTIVLFFSDNGGHARFTSMEPLRGSKGMLYEGGVREPLIVRWPGVVVPGTTCDVPVISIDLFPTLLAAAGVVAPETAVLDGLDLRPLLAGGSELARDAIFWHFPAYLESYTVRSRPWRTTPTGAIRMGRYKLHEFFESGRTELYDLEVDPGETNDLVLELPEVAREIRARLAAWRSEVGAPVPTQPNMAYVPGEDELEQGRELEQQAGEEERAAAALEALELAARQAAEVGPQEPDAVLAELEREPSEAIRTDWLIEAPSRGAGAYVSASGRELVLENGLIRRAFRLTPNAATVAYDDLRRDAALLRAVRPEAIVTLDEREYPVGGLIGQAEQGYLLPAWVDDLTKDLAAFALEGVSVRPTRAPFEWARVRPSEGRPWPPPGVGLELSFRAPPGPHAGVRIVVHYEMYDGIPLTAKWFELENGTGRALTVNRYVSDLLAAVEAESDVEDPWRWRLPPIHAETNYEFGGFTPRSAALTARWESDPDYKSQVNYGRKTPSLLVSSPNIGPMQSVAAGEHFTSHTTYQLVYDSDERERRGLALRRMYRTIAPWSTENPMLMHVRYAEPEAVKLAIDQCADVGFEMVIMTFGSGFSIENEDPAYIASIKALVDYAHEKGIQLGGYSLLSSRRVSDEHDVIDPETGKPGGAKFGNAPCLESEWGRDYFRKLESFITQTGLDLLEHDGSYPGDPCGSEEHPGHFGYDDSQWLQMARIAGFYRWCRARGVYLNVPDWYFLNGSSKIGMGYRETNWSLPRDQQILLARQNIYDGTWEKTPSMGWMFVPLVQYHGGGEEATLEPLSEHLAAYEAHLANNLGAGVQACWRGPRLYDTEETRALVTRWVDFFKEHRAILESDIVHLRRADGRDIDGMLHVNPNLQERGFLSLYNPTEHEVERALTVPLYYTGLTTRTRVRDPLGGVREYELDRDYTIQLTVRVPARGYAHYVFAAP